MTTDQLLEYYVDLLIVQYKLLPKARGTIKCLVNNAIADGLPQQLQVAFNLETAVGAQLTIIGRIVGVPRNIYGLDLSKIYFNFTRFTTVPPSHGFNRWTTVADSMNIARWRASGAFYTLTDAEMLALIKLRIIYNNAYESLYYIKNALYDYFHGAIDVVDNSNATVDYNFMDPYHNVATVAQFLGNVCPKPAGIGITINSI